MSGHITRMSRGSRVGSSASRPSSTSRSTSTWRAGPWQLCTCTERSSRLQRPSRRRARRWRRGRPAASRAACPGDGRRRRRQVLVGLRGRRAGRAAARGGRGRGWPAAGGRPRGGWCRRGGRIWPWTPASDCHSVVAGVRQPQVHVVVGGQRVEQLDLGDGQPGVAEQREPLGQVGGRLLQRGKRFSRAGCGAGRRRRGSAARARACGCQARSERS